MSKAAEDLDPIALHAIERVAEGATLVEISEALGMTGGAVYARISANAELLKRYQMARETAADMLETEQLEIIRRSTPQSAPADRVKLAGLQWILSRRCPRRYADRIALDHTSPDGSMSPKEQQPVSAELVAALAAKLVD